ncbi:differentially expressed in FDCP 6 homolog isoform X2 [Acipenser ruthenus]|uniref:differentially expressed in FDCP 6 homolog isoform X2 n=1 Tax=Acipenser ruthenus TaxID=7906 RepID=UPI0027426CCE|nr:differentially expressed in FDCP 6 homolog isoform X2 [Acipenser ruthenus]
MYAFTPLLFCSVLSHNLYTALHIPHDPVALEEHFQDNDDGPVSNQGYMPYLNKYILAKANDGTFDKETFDDLCWMMTAKKNYKPGMEAGLCSRKDAFKLWCLFNMLSEDRYPLVMIPEEVEYLLKKIASAMSLEWEQNGLDDCYCQDPTLLDGMTVWTFLELMGSGRLLKSESTGAVSLAVDEVFQEMYHDVLKKGYMWKKGLVRRNWNERWFVLKPSVIQYYVSEDLKEKKGEILLDKRCITEAIQDKDGRRCLFCIKTANRTFEISASDLKHRLEWMQAIQTAIRLLAEGKRSLHKELKLRRRENREQSSKQKEEQQTLQGLQEEKERQIQEREQLEAEALQKEEEEREWEKQQHMQRALERQLREAEKARANMATEIAQKEAESEKQRLRIRELELTQQALEKALEAEIQARVVEELATVNQASLLEEEEEKLKQLRCLKEEQEALLQQTQREKHEILQDMTEKAQALKVASQELEKLQESRQKSNQFLEEAKKKLCRASCHVKHWNVQLNRIMKPISPGGPVGQGQPALNTEVPVHQRGAFTSNEFIVKKQLCNTDRRLSGAYSPNSHSVWPSRLYSEEEEEEEEEVQDQLRKVSLTETDSTRCETNRPSH